MNLGPLLLIYIVILVSQCVRCDVYFLSDSYIECRGMDRETFERVNEKIKIYKQLLAEIKFHKSIDRNELDTNIDDVLVTERMIDSMIEELQSRRNGRMKRKAMNEETFTSFKWKFPIKIAFDGSHDSAQKDVIYDSIQDWESTTCVRFDEPDSGPIDIVFTAGNNDGCRSYLGNATSINPQPIYLQSNCLNFIGIPIHEIGHALGLFHEHQRPDRDGFVNVIDGNIIVGRESNFVKRTAKEIDTKGIKYDYASVMHYSSTAFSVANDQNTIETVDPRYQKTIGQRMQISFRDAKIINAVYCEDSCASYPPLDCQGEGYQDPNDCTQCICPDGLGGLLCDSIAKSSPACGADTDPLKATATPQCIESPNLFSDAIVTQGTHCHWQIEAPAGMIVDYFFEFLSMPCSGASGNKYCSVDWVEVKDSAEDGVRYCCEGEIKRIIKSTTNSINVNFLKNYQDSVAFFRLCYQAGVDQCGGTCHEDASCVANDSGDLECTCNENFEGDGVTCTSSDPCGGTCHEAATCVVTPSGDATCHCPAPYTGDGETCSTIDPCDKCHADATCDDATKECSCNEGFTGDGIDCKKVDCSPDEDVVFRGTPDPETCTDCKCAIKKSKRFRSKCEFTVAGGETEPEACMKAGCCWEKKPRVPYCYLPREEELPPRATNCTEKTPARARKRKGWRGISEADCTCLGACFDDKRRGTSFCFTRKW